MKVGDLVRHRMSEGGMLGCIVGWRVTPTSDGTGRLPVVCWQDGRTSPTMIRMLELINASR